MGDPSHKDHLSEEDVAQDIQGLSVCNFNDVQSGRDSSITSVEADALSTSPQGNRDGSPSGGLAKYGVIESETLKHLPSNGNKNKQKTKDDGLNKDIAKAATIKNHVHYVHENTMLGVSHTSGFPTSYYTITKDTRPTRVELNAEELEQLKKFKNLNANAYTKSSEVKANYPEPSATALTAPLHALFQDAYRPQAVSRESGDHNQVLPVQSHVQKTRRASSSTRDVSRFFPDGQPLAGASLKTSVWPLSQNTSVFSTTPDATFADFSEGIQHSSSIPQRAISNTGGDVHEEHVASKVSRGCHSRDHFQLTSGQTDRKPEPLGSDYQSTAPATQPRRSSHGSQSSVLFKPILNMGPPTIRTGQAGSPYQAVEQKPSLSSTTASDSITPPRHIAPSRMPIHEDFSASRITSPSQNDVFFQPEESGLTLMARHKAPSRMATPVHQRLQAPPTAFQPHLTNVKELEKAAESSDNIKTLPITRPNPSRGTNVQDWRSTATGAPDLHVDKENPNMESTLAIMASRPPIMAPRPAGLWPTAAIPPAHLPAAPLPHFAYTPVPFQNNYPKPPQSNPEHSSALVPTTNPTAPAPTIHRPFKPMNNVLYPATSKKPLTEEEKASRVEVGISPNYQGNPYNPKNRSENIPDSQNCALFLTNLPATCNYQELLQAMAIHRPGRIWTTYINPPRKMDADDPLLSELQAAARAGGSAHLPRVPPSYSTSAAKVIFYHPFEAQRLIVAAARGLLRVGGRRIGAKWNRHKTGAQKYDRATSRAITIGGPATIVNEVYLRGLFDQYFEYNTEEVLLVAEAEGQGWCVLEWRFACMRAQAHAAYQLLKSLYPGVVEVRWAVDPCAGYLSVEDVSKELMRLGGGVQPIEGI